jgi:signal transduction histidine kinase
MPIVPLEHRAGRVIAASRTFLALFFLAASLIGPATGTGAIIRPLLLLYLAASLLLALIGWNRWWLEHRLALPAHYLDLGLFAALILLSGGYGSPYFGLSTFLIIGAAMRWRTHQALITILLVVLVFLASFWLAPARDAAGGADLPLFLARGASLFVLAGLALWLWLDQLRSASAARESQHLDEIVTAEPPARECLAYAAERLGARRALLLWSEADEPWLNLLSWEGKEIVVEKLGPEAVPNPLDDLPTDHPYLFDCRGRRMLVLDGDAERMALGVDPLPPAFAARYGIEDGLAVSVRTSRHSAMVVAADIAGLCTEFLATACLVRGDIASAFERAALLGSMREASVAASRLSLARNLHDGAAQFLAGIALKLHAAKESLADPDAARRSLEDLEAELVRQQHDLRTIIQNLRQPPGRVVRLDLDRHLESLAQRLRGRWGIEVDAAADSEEADDRELTITTSFRYELEQMIGEAASNAVRHGGARQLRLRFARDAVTLRLEIADDGTGFPFAGLRSDAELWQRRLGPLSLHQRVRSLGGTLAIQSSRTGSTLSLVLPLEEQPR